MFISHGVASAADTILAPFARSRRPQGGSKSSRKASGKENAADAERRAAERRERAAERAEKQAESRFRRLERLIPNLVFQARLSSWLCV